MKTTRLLVLTLVLALSAAIVAGCGSSSGSGGDDDPAALIPAGAPLYIEGVVRPDGQVRTDLEGALKKILRTDDPGAKIQQLVDSSGKTDDITFKDDVEPWVGNRVGFAITALHNGQNADYAAVIDSTDDAKAEKLLAKQKGTVKRSYNGTDYRFDAKEKTATALIDHHVVVATEGGLKAIVDGKGKDHLDQANGLTAVRSKVAQDRIGLFYLDVGLRSRHRPAGQQRPAGRRAGAVVRRRGAQDARRGAAGSARRPARRRGQHRDAAVLDARRQRRGHARDAPRQRLAGAGRRQPGPDARPRRPGGGRRRRVHRRRGQRAAGAVQEADVADLRKDVLGWMGDAGVFVGGSRAPISAARSSSRRPTRPRASARWPCSSATRARAPARRSPR